MPDPDELSRLESSEQPPPYNALADAWMVRARSLLERDPAAAETAARHALRLSTLDATPYWTAAVEALSILASTARLAARSDDAVTAARQSVELAAASGDALTHSAAMLSQGLLLLELNRFEEAIAVFEDLTRRLTGGPELLLAYSLRGKALALLAADKYDEAVLVGDELIRRFERYADPEVARYGSTVKAMALAALGRYQEAVLAFDDVIQRLDGDAANAEAVADYLARKGTLLVAMGRYEEALLCCEELMRRFENRTEAKLAAPVARAQKMSTALRAILALDRPSSEPLE